MLTEPIGPRSPDDILAVVYQRTERARRRRRRHVGVGMAVVALGVTGLLSLRSGDDEASRVRVVDDPNPKVEETATPPTTVLPAAPTGPASATKVPSKRPSSAPAPAGNATGSTRNTSPTAPPLPTTTTTVPLPDGPSTKVLAQATDDPDDAVLPEWYYEIVSGTMQVDLRSDMVLFTTQYATPQGSGPRQSRTLRSEFVYENAVIRIDVTETNNTLGTVRFDGDCDACSKSFDEARGRLVVGIPVDLMNEYLTRHHGNGHSIEDAVVSSLTLVTTAADLGVEADRTGGQQ